MELGEAPVSPEPDLPEPDYQVRITLLINIGRALHIESKTKLARFRPTSIGQSECESENIKQSSDYSFRLS